MMRFYLVFWIYPFLCFGQKQDILIHSHNDYFQKEPLSTALDYGVNSIEVDVALYKNEIKVCHFPIFLKNKPNLETLYLNPLLENKTQITSVKFLFIDIKSGGTEILENLNLLISKYPEIFASRSESNSNKIQIIISGTVDRDFLINSSDLSYLFVDGRVENLYLNIDSKLVPIISENFKKLSKEKQLNLIKTAHQENKKVRFWNTADNQKTWKKLLSLDVDFIGVDDIEKFNLFINSK